MTQPTPSSQSPERSRVRLRLSRAGWGVIAAGLLTIAIVVGASILMLWRERDAAIADWKANLSQMSIMLAEHTRQTMTASDLVLQSIRDRVNDAGIETDADLRREMGTREIFDMLRNRASSAPQVDVATIVALNGDVINFTRAYPPPPINLADRDYFKAHLADPKLDVFLSVPVKNRGTGTWTFYLARKIKSPHGKMLGIVITGIQSSFFEEFYRAVNIGEDSAISLFRQDGILLARYPQRENLVGTSFANQAVFRDIIGTGKASGSVITSSPRLADGWATNELRIVAPRQIAGYPLVVNITATASLIFETWSITARFVGGGALLFALLLLGLTAWIATLLTRREQTMGDLRRARREAEEAAHAKSEFLAMMSHEIRTPMNAVIGTSSLLADSPLEPAQRRFVRIIEDSASHLLAIINDILDLSRLETGRLDIEKNLFDPRELAENAVELARSLKGAEKLEIATALAGNLPRLLVGDAGRLNQVLLNLLSNAVKYTERGAVTLSAAIVDQSDSTLRVRFAVTDTGAGIGPEVRSRLFQPFEQGDSKLARRKGGTGLGLAICKRIVDMMGGRIAFDSELGHGSTFWFEVPLDRAPAGARLEVVPAAASTGPKRNLRVLVAEDTPANQVVARAMLEKLGHKVQIVGDGDEAVQAARSTGFDLILMDVQMPTMDGYEATRRIRAQSGPSQRTPILALTAFAQASDREAALAAGMTDYLSKPIRLSELAAAIDRIIPAAPGAEALLAAVSGAPEVPDAVPTDAGAADVLDEESFGELAESVGDETFRRLVAAFLSDAAKALDEVEARAAEANVAQVKRSAHRLTGLFDQFGARRAADAAAAVESAADGQALTLAHDLGRHGREAIAAIARRVSIAA